MFLREAARLLSSYICNWVLRSFKRSISLLVFYKSPLQDCKSLAALSSYSFNISQSLFDRSNYYLHPLPNYCSLICWLEKYLLLEFIVLINKRLNKFLTVLLVHIVDDFNNSLHDERLGSLLERHDFDELIVLYGPKKLEKQVLHEFPGIVLVAAHLNLI